MRITAIITAAGKGTRAGLDKNKVLTLLPDGKTVLEHSAAPFDKDERVTELIFAASKEDFETIKRLADGFSTPTKVVEGGKTRFDSVKSALNAANGEFVMVHDGARPFVTEKIVSDCITTLLDYGSAVACVPCTDTIGTLNASGEIESTSRKDKTIIQTPQAFMTCDLKKAFSLAKSDDCFTDEAGVYCKYVGRAHAFEGARENVKLTYPEDFEKVRAGDCGFLPENVRAGTGYDLHLLEKDRKLVIGGVDIPYEKGLLGHSDADVLIHAVMDALLSAAALKDIGCRFSDKDPQYKDISSMILLEKTAEIIFEAGFVVNNVSAVIMAEKPKLNPYADLMKRNIASVLRVGTERIGISCTTLEGAGLIGNEQAMAASAVCTIIKNKK